MQLLAVQNIHILVTDVPARHNYMINKTLHDDLIIL